VSKEGGERGRGIEGGAAKSGVGGSWGGIALLEGVGVDQRRENGRDIRGC